MEMKKRKNIAKKRRAKLLAEIEKRGCTQQTLADKYGVTVQRINSLLRKARRDIEF